MTQVQKIHFKNNEIRRILCKYNVLVELIQNQQVNKSMMIFSDTDENIITQSAEAIRWYVKKVFCEKCKGVLL